MTAAQIFTALAGVIAIFSLAVYLFGIPPELKRKLERKALQTMGENKMSYALKGISPQPSRSCLSLLTPSRPNQQGPRIRPRERQAGQAGSRQPRRRCYQQPVG
jgi:hypothetical protein